MGRRILAVIAGIVTAFILVMLIEWLGHLVVPPPEGLDPTDPESIRAMMDQISPLSLIMVAIAWACAAFGGAWVAGKIGGPPSRIPALIVGGLLVAGSIMNLIVIPHPIWFWFVGLLPQLPLALLGGKIGEGGSSGASGA